MSSPVWLCPLPNPELQFESWSPLLLLAATVLAEAEGEEKSGKRAVAEVVMNRVRDARWPDTIPGVVLQPRQFSCFDDSRLKEKMRHPKRYVSEESWNSSFWAAVEAVRQYEPAYVGKATHYLNEKTVLAAAGKLPRWFQEDNVQARLGNHTFLTAT